MAKILLSTANSLPPTSLLTSSSSATTTTTAAPATIYSLKHNVNRHYSLIVALCKEASEFQILSSTLTRRGLAICLTASTFSLSGFSHANAAILEADDDVELLERVKKDRKKRLEKQEVIKASKAETAYLQEVVYKLSKVGQAIDNNELSVASSVLGSSTDAEWVRKVNVAFSKLSSSPEEKTVVDSFNLSLASLISSVIQNDIESSKRAFVSSASALEKWTALTGLVEQLKGL
ncbi:thylakoid lumenal 16.5 kDa protein, chloroplastic [Telopea speciosissima]|uniref:thylakoid lumenal 16.5 kDa protein, chloroplastic n=1 Tax=Telopea speciosissima TaxID=54955 RepID=UPI001CC66A28|nr:thylakoid lumenal 16.5 kDa protein, chloroplastic [Telopea speciosissima]